MIKKGSVVDYILHLMKESDRYPVFKIPGAVRAGGQFVMLHDTYTHLNIVPRSEYELPLTDVKQVEKNITTDVIETFEKITKIDELVHVYQNQLDEFFRKRPPYIDNIFKLPLTDLKQVEKDITTDVIETFEKITKIDELLHADQNQLAEFFRKRPPYFDSIFRGNPDRDELDEIEELLEEVEASQDELEALTRELQRNISLMERLYDEKTQATGSQRDERKGFSEQQKIDNGKTQLANPEKWSIFLSAPGGGKSTLLKMYALVYGYQYLKSIGFDFLSDDAASVLIKDYEEGGEYGDDLKQYVDRIESICDQLSELEAIDACFPFFIEARNLSNNIDRDTDIEDILKKSISNFIYGDSFENIQSYPEEIDVLFNHIDNIVLIVDSIEEFIKPESKDDFIEKLNEYDKSRKKTVRAIVLSSRYKEYQDFEHESEKNDKEIRQYVIKELYRDFDLITEFSEKWFNSLAFVNNDDEIRVDFIESLRANDQAVNLITNPLELTGLLLVSVSDRFLPSDLAKLYARSTELWLTWANKNRYNLDDVMIQVAHLAYQMAESKENRIKINRGDLHQLIRKSREDLRKYFKQDWDDSDVESFVEFLCDSHLLIFSSGAYEFYHRMYQAYYVAYCIHNSLFKNRKPRKYDYLEEHINERDDFWNSIILLTAILDFDLRDELIDKLLNYANNQPFGTWYYLSILMQLVVVPGINFDKNELKELYTIIARDTNKPRYVSNKRQDIFKALSVGDEFENDIFVNVILDEYDAITDDAEKDDYRDAFATCIFFCLWNCRISDQSILRGLKAFFPNYIDTSIVSEIYHSSKNGNLQAKRLYTLVRELGRKSLYGNEPVSDYYMMIAVMYGYMTEGLSPYDKVLELLKTDDLENQVIAANILVISAWLIKIFCDRRFNYSSDMIEGKEETIAQFINTHIADKNNLFRRDYIAAYLDYYSSYLTPKLVELLTNEAAFDSCAEIAVDLWRREKEDGTLKYEGFSRELEYVATYPKAISRKLYKYLDENDEIKDFIEYINKVVKNSETTDFKTKLEGLKLLTIVDGKNVIIYTSKMKTIIEENDSALRESYIFRFADKIFRQIKHDWKRWNLRLHMSGD